jgi:hypothetical protein
MTIPAREKRRRRQLIQLLTKNKKRSRYSLLLLHWRHLVPKQTNVILASIAVLKL